MKKQNSILQRITIAIAFCVGALTMISCKQENGETSNKQDIGVGSHVNLDDPIAGLSLLINAVLFGKIEITEILP